MVTFLELGGGVSEAKPYLDYIIMVFLVSDEAWTDISGDALWDLCHFVTDIPKRLVAQVNIYPRMEFNFVFLCILIQLYIFNRWVTLKKLFVSFHSTLYFEVCYQFNIMLIHFETQALLVGFTV